MSALPRIVLTLLLLVQPAAAAEFTGRVVAVHDGDTIRVLVGREQVKCRLANIDAPELGQPFGRNARRALSALVFQRAVHVEDRGEDRYGRKICLVDTDDGQANRAMVAQGMAWVYGRYNTDPDLPATEAQARAERLGLWADSNAVPPWAWRKLRSSQRRGGDQGLVDAP